MHMNVDRWFAKIYGEKDFGRSIAATLSGVAGLVTYLLSRDWVLSAFVWIIVFPLFRLVASALHTRWRAATREQKLFQTFSPEEKEVIKAFVDAGGAALSYSQINRAALPRAAIESLVSRGVLFNTTLSDCMTEGFILKTEVFDGGQRMFPRLQPPSRLIAPNGAADEVPF